MDRWIEYGRQFYHDKIRLLTYQVLLIHKLEMQSWVLPKYLSNSVLPVVAGLAFGVGLIIVMIIVADSFHRYDGRVDIITFRDGNVEYFSQPGDIIVDEGFFSSGVGDVNLNDQPSDELPFDPSQVIPMEETEEVDGCCDDVATIEFGPEINIPLTDND